MSANQIIDFENAEHLANYFQKLHETRRKLKSIHKKRKRKPLQSKEREVVLSKTGGMCHICGGKIEENKIWEADHVVSHAQGGESVLDNYLPAHRICNNYRWDYSPEEFQWILKLGVWFRTKIEGKKDKDAFRLAEKFVKYEKKRSNRKNK